jgi:hypothetical protein
MMGSMEGAMAEAPEENGGNGLHVIWIAFAGLAMFAIVGAIAAFLAVHNDHGGGALSAGGIAVMVAFVAMLCGLAYAIWRNAQKIKLSGEPLSRRERLNRNIMTACILLGGVTGVALAFSGTFKNGDDFGHSTSFLYGPIPLPMTLVIVFFWLVVMPVVTWFWHTRAIDEQEASAYRDGGYYAANAYLFLAPAWWVLWRGGLLPEPNDIAIYLAFSIIWTAVWFRKKYS